MKNQNWIQGGKHCESPWFRRAFSVSSPTKAKLEICGLGFFKLYVNGKPVETEEMVPALTNYSSLAGHHTTYPVWEERSRFRTFYLVYDLLPYLQEGENVLGVQLGNGWYHQTRRTAEGDFAFGFPKLHFELTLEEEDGTERFLESDPETLWTESHIVENNLFYGETQDFRKYREDWAMPGIDLNGWHPSLPCDAPETELEEQDCPFDRVVRRIVPKLLFEQGEFRLYDCGENISGWVDVRCPASEGTEITVLHSENLGEDGRSLDFRSAGGEEQIQKDRYFCGSREITARPAFCWHGFRYFSVSGPGIPQSVSVVHTDIPATSDFSCSDPVLTWLYRAYVRTQLNNIHGCIPSDCPHRERLGYTGDGQITAPAAMMTLEPVKTKEMYRKWMRDILDSQGVKTGHIPHTAPFMGGGGGPGGWGGAVFVVPMAYYRAYGDLSLLRDCYPPILRWLEYMEAHSENHLVVREEKDGWCLGDWCPPPSMEHPELPPTFVNTYYYIKGLRCAMEAAELLGREAPPELKQRMLGAEKAMVQAYFDPQTESFYNGVNGADAFALDLGLGTPQTRKNLIDKYEERGCLDTGIFGTYILIKTLFREGAGGLAYRLLTSRKGLSFANMMESGATTLWETWSGEGSHDHPMFGAVVELLFTEILGIRQKENSAGYESYTIDPVDVPELEWAKGFITTCRGTIEVDWSRDSQGKIQIFSK